jgi:DNA (cytosine-5)-methyltransferase 1
VPSGKLDLLVASPECTHHSNARGGKPASDQSRASAWCVLRWATALQIDRIIIENVPEFISWGPLGANNKPLQSRKGETFKAFKVALESLGYRTDWRVLNSADFGAATSRRRLFLQAVRGRREIHWPDATHDVNPRAELFSGARKRWRGAREIINWNLTGQSIFDRKRPLSANTLARIEAGLRKFGGKNAEPFIVLLRGTAKDQVESSARAVSGPVPTVTASGNHVGLVEPFILPPEGIYRGNPPRSLNDPLQTVTAGRGGACLVQLTHGGRVLGVDDPLPTVTTANRGEIAIVQPFILPHRQFEQMDVDSVDRPMRTVTATNGGCNALVQPFLVPYYGACHEADSLSDPMRTATTKDRLGLVEPSGDVRLDIRFRMLQPSELAAAMGFPAGYKITGNRGEQVKQIGNAVEVNQAKALATPYVSAA